MKETMIYLCTFVLSLISFSSFSDPFTGYYAGVSGGGSFLRGSKDASFAQMMVPDQGGNFGVSRKHGIKNSSLIGMLSLGYGETFSNNGYLGGELFVDWTNHKSTSSFEARLSAADITLVNHTSGWKVDPVSYGLDLRPGYQISDFSLLYVRVGVGVKRVSQFIDINSDASGGGGPSITPAFVSKAVTRAVLRLGFGFEYALMDNLNFRADYIFNYLGNFRQRAESSMTVGGTLSASRAADSIHLVDNSFLFGLCWHW